MALALNEQTIPSSNLSSTNSSTPQHENLLTDPLLARALQAILDGISADRRIQARQMREKAGFTLAEAIQVLRYLHRQGILGEEVDGRRVVNRELANDYLSILAPAETPTQAASAETHTFSQAQIAWACMHARDDKLTPMRIARPSRWTIALAQALGLTSSNIPGELILPTSRAKRLCDLITDMSEEERAPYISWAESQLPADENAED